MATPESNPLDAASPLEPSQPLAVAAGSAASRMLWHWADDLGAEPEPVTILGPASPEWRGPKGITVQPDGDPAKYVALPHELTHLPNNQGDTPKGLRPGGCV